MPLPSRFAALLLPWLAWPWLVAAGDAGKRLEFGRDIRPILSNHCFACHGNDEGKRKAGLRLDTEEGATALLASGGHAIVPGDADESKLVARITADSAKRRMPPEKTGKPLTPEEIGRLKLWVEQGAEYKKHWSLIPPRRTGVPTGSVDDPDRAWPRNDVDRFLLARMKEEGLRPSPEAPPETLIRRVTFALTGLPPTPAEVNGFLADLRGDAAHAYDRLVQRLLGSPRFGEQMARTWLDLARYGDTHGYHLDNERSLWRWREWVIDAFNRNEPFDRFTVEQLAGDLLPNPTQEQLIATGFDRCNPTTGEGGLIEEEYLVKYVVDRVNTTATIWLGLTVGCAQCHDHRFDPISQRDYYGLFAFFNNIAERGTDDNALSPAPSIPAPSPAQAAALAELRARIAAEEAKLAAPMPEVDAAQAAWEADLAGRLTGRWQVVAPTTASATGGTTFTELADHSLLAGGANPERDVYELTFAGTSAPVTALRIEALADPSLPLGGPGRFDNANFVLTGLDAEVVAPTATRKIDFVAATADHAQENFPVTNVIDGDAATGWAILPQTTAHQAIFVPTEPIVCGAGEQLRLRLRFESQFRQHSIGRVRVAVTSDAALAPVRLGPWNLLGPFTAADGNAAYTTPFGPEATLAAGVDFAATWDDLRPAGATQRAWSEKPDWSDGRIWNLEGDFTAWYLARPLESSTARAVTLSFGSDDALKVWLNGRIVLDRNVERSVKPEQDTLSVDLEAGRNLLVMKVVNYQGGAAFWFKKMAEEPDGIPLALEEALARPAPERSAEQSAALRDHYRRRHAPAWRAIAERVAPMKREEQQQVAAIPPTMVAQELMQPRPTTILLRGQYDHKGDAVEAALPPALGRLPEGAPRNRLGFAQWLVDRDQPLTARVTVNRLWQQFFGTGIVKTAQDFGAQGEWPTHQELLDWLAVEFMESGWDVKHLVELMVTSAAFRESSRLTPELLEKDHDNRFLARGPRFRLDAEEIRDAALFASGLLVERIGGRSVKPYQPGNLWKVVAYPTSNTANFVQDHGEALWRRSLYTFWKRTSPPPNLTTFDAPSRESCTVQRARTDTPLQALVLMNDVQFVEAARVLAQRLIREGGADPAARVELGFRLLLSRRPNAQEAAILLRAAERELVHYRADPAAAQALITQGEAPVDPALGTVIDAAELAAWTLVATTLLNLDETVTRG